ncbi:MAG: hypothetical protein QOJ99_3528 [Bryobacterales bacterium]|jgi:hypothetical protein|nr:hypothetical protein [Bryobacterales bacterium]
MADAKLRQWWWHKQGLDGSLVGRTAAQVLSATGWARSVAGAGPYLTFFSRAALRRPEVDAALAAVEIHELPSARGCTYVLPASDYALGLKAGQTFGGSERKVASKLGVTDDEIDRLRAAVARALAKGPLDPDALRTAVGDAVRNLGPEGVKKGMTTTLPLALGAMQGAGEIRRIPVNGRLDQQRYRYALWNPNPLFKCKLSSEESFVELAREYFRWTGCASLSEFQWFSGLSAKAAKVATGPLKLEPLDDRMMLPEDREAFEKFKPSKQPQYALVSSLDAVGQLRRDLKSLLADEDHEGILGDNGRISDMPSHAIMDRGRVVGWWEYEPATSTIVWMSLVKPDRALQEAVNTTEAFIREDLGDARSFSLDSPKSRAPRIEALRGRKLK